MAEIEARGTERTGGPAEVLLAFLRLGLIGLRRPDRPGLFPRRVRRRRGWLAEPAFADLVALCSIPAGPGVEPVGLAIGLTRAGWLGGLAAWAGLRAPSAALMLAFAYGAAGIAEPGGAQGRSTD